MVTGMLRVRQWHHAAFKCSSDDPISHVLEVVLPTFGAFKFIRSKCGSNMDAKMLLCILSLGAFKWRKQMMQVMKYIKQIWTLPSTQRWLSSAMLQLHITSTQQLPYQNFLQLSELFLRLEGTFTSNFPVGNVFFGLFRHHMNALLEPL